MRRYTEAVDRLMLQPECLCGLSASLVGHTVTILNHLCEQAAHGDNTGVANLLAVQREEFECVFDYPWCQAVGEARV